MCGVMDILVLLYVCHYKTFLSFRPQDVYFSSIYLYYKTYPLQRVNSVATLMSLFLSGTSGGRVHLHGS